MKTNKSFSLVHRCDSDHTAEMLYTHLQALIERPENQKKFADIERKLQMRGALPSTKKPPDSSLGSEVSRESDSGSNEERCVANLYDSLAAELKQKLSTGKRGLGQSHSFIFVGRHASMRFATVFGKKPDTSSTSGLRYGAPSEGKPL
ncbi:hypothetical protein HF086_016898 [Spodoptera exigua]|uniref:Uncharacterized protein n=1 Tax=Spodoptera exigua TaxID=7107 RepID=A0A922M9J0_SPOEX|nr:hypothetical protein HF086_016898 [Spodoptera exigua]